MVKNLMFSAVLITKQRFELKEIESGIEKGQGERARGEEGRRGIYTNRFSSVL